MIEKYINTYSSMVFMLAEEQMIDEKRKFNPLGTAFLCHKDGLFLTCSHIIDITKKYYLIDPKDINQFNPISIYGNITAIEVIIKQYNSLNDVALLKIKNWAEIDFNCILGKKEPMLVGESIYYLGYPFLNLGLHNLTISSSIISSKVKFDNGTNQYQIDSIVHEGNSGGPLIDLKTNTIIGIISGTFDPQNKSNSGISFSGRTLKEVTSISYATPIEYGLELLKNEGKI